MATQVHILTPSILPGDAVSNDVLGMMRWFRNRGFVARAYAQRCHPKMRKKVLPVRAYRRHLANRNDILIYHHSVGWPIGYSYYAQSSNRKIVKYHNVTPSRFYRGHNRIIYRACLGGQQETEQLIASKPSLFLADSEFNAEELIRLGADRHTCRIVHPFHRLCQRRESVLDERLCRRLQGRLNLLFVGRLAPNKGQIHLIRALGYYRRHFRSQAHLILIGNFDPGLETYWCSSLHREVCRQGVQECVQLPGKVSALELRTYYAHAFAFLCASEHEGFCVPLIEAMHHGVPIVAYSSSAVSSTLADACLLWETPDPRLFAESIRLLLERPELRQQLIEQQKGRFETHFKLCHIDCQLQDALAPLL
jgi:glycosyltransferase involved in cell wall biosynthesis